MRAAAATVVGLIAGGVLGFALRGWFIEDPSHGDSPTASRADAAAAPASALPAVSAAPAELLALAPAALAPAAAGGESSAGAFADSLVGILVYGAVLDPEGRPAQLGDARWMQFDSGAGEPRSVQVSSTSTYAICGLEPGTCTVRTNFLGFRPFDRELELDAAHPAVRLDIVLQPAVVLMVKAFTPTGENLSDALQPLLGEDVWGVPLAAIATREPPPARLREISHRFHDRWDIGYYTAGFEQMFQDDAFPEDVIGKLELDEPLPAYVSLMFRHIVLQTQTVEPGTTEVVFVVPLESVSGLLGEVRVKVVDAETRQPIANATAELSDSQSGGARRPSDAAGVFKWERQRPGLLELQITAPGYENWDGEVSIPPGGVADLGTLALTPATSVSGIVLDQAGQPVSAGLRALADEGRALGMGARRHSQSGADGRFECTGLGRRLYRLVVSDQDWTGLPVPVDLRPGSVEGVVVTVAPGAPVRIRTSWPASERYGVRVITQDGLVISDADVWESDWAWTRRMLPGDYIAILVRDGLELQRVPFHVGAEDVSVELAP